MPLDNVKTTIIYGDVGYRGNMQYCGPRDIANHIKHLRLEVRNISNIHTLFLNRGLRGRKISSHLKNKIEF